MCCSVFVVTDNTRTNHFRTDLFDSEFERFVPWSVSRLMRQSFMAVGVGDGGMGGLVGSGSLSGRQEAEVLCCLC